MDYDQKKKRQLYLIIETNAEGFWSPVQGLQFLVGVNVTLKLRLMIKFYLSFIFMLFS